MKTLRYKSFLLPFVFLTTLFTARGFAQGGGCSSLNLSLEQIDACTYRLYFNNQAADCFQQMTILIDSGEFGSWSPNTAGGWNVAPTSATELEVSHDNGLFPAGPGYILDVQIDGTASATLTVLYYYDCPLGEGCAADFAVTGCPDPQDASIIGVKYKECGILPFTNQTPLAGWTIQLFDQDDNLLAEDVTDSTGAYGFFDLLGGVYTVREVQQPGWTPKVPASGEYLIDLDASEQRTVNYGNCPPPKPPCNCPAGTQPAAVNLVQNGDFSGSGGFSSGYAQNNNNPPLQPGQYWIGSNPNAINSGFSACSDHTGGGNMLVVNGGPSPSTPFWSQTIAVTPNTTYIFEAWAASLTSASSANLSLFVIINSLNVQYEVGRFFPSATPCDWQRWCETWQTGNYTSITLCLYDLNPTAAGNDFALDDISFRRCVNPIAEVTGVLYESCDSLPYTDQPVLAGWTVQLLDTLGNVLDTTVTDGNGAYAFGSLPPANYYARAVVQPDWTPVAPPFGLALIELEAGEEAVQHFGMCFSVSIPCACPVPYSPGANLAMNGDFSLPGGFGTQYALNNNNPPLLSGEYWIGSNPNAINSAFQACTDHTTGTGDMLVLLSPPANPASMSTVWSQPFIVTPNTNYIISAWVTALDQNSTGTLQFLVGNTVISTFPFFNTPCSWKRFCVSWNSGSKTSITLKLNSNFFFSQGNAFAIDDISFRPCEFSVNPTGIIAGTTYRTCDSLPYTDQPLLAGWPVQLLDSTGNLLSEQVTDSTGTYGFGDLPPANYYVKVVQQPGWTPNVPASGQVAVNLGDGEEVVEHFGMCPECSCDSMEIIPYQIQSLSDTGFYQLSLSNQSPYCFSHFEIELDAVGEFVGWDSVPPGWTVELMSPKLVRVHWAEPFLPAGSFLPVLLKAKGEGEQKLMVSAFRDDGSAPCVRGYQNPVPTPQDDCCIDPGPYNLIPNGSFSSGNAFFSSDYNLNCNNLTVPGRYCITTNPNAANGNFSACGDYTTGGGLMLVANGSTQSSKKVWYTSTSIPVTPYTNYKFIFHYTPVSGSHKPTLGVTINNYNANANVIGNVCSWIGMCVTWNSGNNTSATISIKDLTTNVTGNDFALDDMWFFPCPLPCSVTANLVSVNCNQVDLQAIGTGAGPITYKWCDNQTGNLVTQTLPCGPFSCSVTATCLGGGTATATVSGIITESIDPVAKCQLPYSIDLGNNCTGPVTVGMVDDGSSDNCPGLTLSVSPNVLVACQTNTITLTAKDWCDNTSTCTIDIYAGEFDPPDVFCPPDIQVDCQNFTPGFTGVATATDNCTANPGITYADIVAGQMPCNATVTRTWTATDDCGNTSACIQVINVVDNTPPVLTGCPPSFTVTGSVGPTGLCEAEVLLDNPAVTDNCSQSITVTDNAPVGGIFPFGTTTVVFTATDECNNSATCSFTVTVDCDGSDELCSGNLVPNPSFEQFISCPTGLSGPFTVAAWTLPTDGSADYYNACATAASGVDVPVNTFGNQAPRTGAGYAGFILRFPNLYREYIEVPLSAPLVAGTSYEVSFYVSLSDESQWAIDQLGAYLSVGSVGPVPGVSVLPYVPQVANPGGSFITDETGWTQISGTYVAAGGEDHLVLGNFSDDPGTPLQTGQGGFYTGAYYYVDDVSVCAVCPNPPCDSCCADSLAFNALVAQGFTVTANGCDLTVTAPQFDSCYWFSTPPYIVGGPPVPQIVVSANGSWNFSFTQSGTYQICVGVFDGCNFKTMCTTVTVECSCTCGSFSQMFVRGAPGAQSQQLFCDENSVPLTCPNPGGSYHFTGHFSCAGNNCPPTAPVLWELVRLPNTPVATGTASASPYFGITLLPAYYQVPGFYELRLQGICGTDTCECVLKFSVDCPDPCPCTPTDILALQAAVNAGFASAASNANCKACFAPVALSDCESVEWHLNSTNGPLLGTTTGNQLFCSNFGVSGAYTIVMVVTRLKSDGTLCEAFVYSKTINLLCTPTPVCEESVFGNPAFGAGAGAGGLNSGGASEGWAGPCGNPIVSEGITDGLDPWSIHLFGNLDSADVLGRLLPVCLEKTSGTISMRLSTWWWNDDPPRMDWCPPKVDELLVIQLYRGDEFEMNDCDGVNCFELVSMPLLNDSTSIWWDVEIPYDLSGWAVLDSCGDAPHGVRVRPAIFVTNGLSSDQGSFTETRSNIFLDQFCLAGALVAVETPRREPGIRLFPNPNPGSFTVELPAPAAPGAAFRIAGLTGQVLWEKRCEPGLVRQAVQTGDLPPGLYFLQYVDSGRVIAVEKFVKQ